MANLVTTHAFYFIEKIPFRRRVGIFWINLYTHHCMIELIGCKVEPYIGCPYPCSPMPVGFGWVWVLYYCSWWAWWYSLWEVLANLDHENDDAPAHHKRSAVLMTRCLCMMSLRTSWKRFKTMGLRS